MLAEPQLLVALVLAHLLADFYFQPFTWVQQRNERHALALPLYLHAIIHGILAAAVGMPPLQHRIPQRPFRRKSRCTNYYDACGSG